MTEYDPKLVEAVANAQKAADLRYDVQGTTDDEFGGPPYRAPWFLIDTDKAEPEVNWPGELVAEHDSGMAAWHHKRQLVARAALDAVNASGTHIIIKLSSSQMGPAIEDAIRAAVLQERTKCAEIARDYAIGPNKDGDRRALIIADAIEAQEG